MEGKSKGNFIDFIGDANKDPKLRQQFKETLAKEVKTGQDLLKLFYSLGYDSVSLDDCETILSTAQGSMAMGEVWDARY